MVPDVLDEKVQAASIERALRLYRERLKPTLEPDFHGQIVVIHLDSEDYEVGRTSTQATRLLRQRHPDGITVSLDIGPVPIEDSLIKRRVISSIAF